MVRGHARLFLCIPLKTYFLFAFLDLTEFRTPFTGIRNLRVAASDAWYFPFAGRMNRRAAGHRGPVSVNYKKMLRISCHGPSLLAENFASKGKSASDVLDPSIVA